MVMHSMAHMNGMMMNWIQLKRSKVMVNIMRSTIGLNSKTIEGQPEKQTLCSIGKVLSEEILLFSIYLIVEVMSTKLAIVTGFLWYKGK